MPVLPSEFKPNFFFKNPHLQTILVNTIRSVDLPEYTRERIITPDEDFLEVDWVKQGSKKLIVALHGMEGSSHRHYIKGVLAQMYGAGWDGLGFNFRGCSGQANLKARSYHCGETSDIGFILDRICATKEYETIVLIGFSLGGNVALLYAAEQGARIHPEIKSVIGVSVPCDLPACVPVIESPKNRIYLMRFLQGLRQKVREKEAMLRHLDLKRIYKAQDFQEFDDALTAPTHGFSSAMEYWTTVASLPHLEAIQIPALLINSEDDTFLSPSSTPIALAESSNSFHLMNPAWGGHVGFFKDLKWKNLWSEKQIHFFLTNILGL